MPTGKSNPGNKDKRDKDHQTTPTRRNPQASDEPQKRIPDRGANDDVRIADEEGDPQRQGRGASQKQDSNRG